MQLGGELVTLDESHTCSGSNLRNEGVQSISTRPPAQHPMGKICVRPGVQVTGWRCPSLWRLEPMRIERPGAPLGNGSAQSSHYCTYENFLTSHPWCQRGLDLSLSWALTWNCGRMLTSTRRHRASMGQLCQTSEDKAKWNFKRLQKGPESPFRNQQVLLKSPDWAPIWALKLLLRWKRKFFNAVKLWWNHFTL